MATIKEVKNPSADAGAMNPQTLEKRGEEMMTSAIDGDRDASRLISDISDLMCSNDIVIEDKGLEDRSLELIAKLIGIRDEDVVDDKGKIDAIMQLYRDEISPFLSEADKKIEEYPGGAPVPGKPSDPDHSSREKLAGPVNDPKIASAKIRRLLGQDKFMKTDRKEEAERLMLELEEIEKSDDPDEKKIGEIKKLYNAENGIRQFLAAGKEDARKEDIVLPSERDLPRQQDLEEEADGRRLAEMEEAVDEAREKYAKICCEEKQRNLSFKKIFHKLIRIDTDTHRAALEEYRSKLKELVEYKADKIRFIELEGDNHEEEIRSLIKKLEADERLRLSDFITEFQENQRLSSDRKKAEVMRGAATCVRWYGSQKFASRDATGKALREIGLVDPSGRFPAMEKMKRLKEKFDQEIARLNGAIADFSRNLTKDGKKALLGGIAVVGMALLISHGAIMKHPSKQASENFSVRQSAESQAVDPAPLEERIGSFRMDDGGTSAGPAQAEGHSRKISSSDHAEKLRRATEIPLKIKKKKSCSKSEKGAVWKER
jgi:hypothetical protein